MLLYLTEYLTKFDRGFNVFQYLTFRAILGVLTTLAISFVIGPFFIRHLSKTAHRPEYPARRAPRITSARRARRPWAVP